MAAPNVLISGSGIAGSVLAFWLLRAYRNANITIVERAPSLRLTGASVDIRSSAVDIIKWMGVEQKIRDQTTHEQGIQFVNSSGKPVATIAATGRTDIQTITSEFEIFRGALAKIFIDPVLDRVKLIYDDYVEDFEQQNDGVRVTLAKSKHVQKYDYLIAADGLGSRIRAKMLNAKPRDHVHDEGVHAAYFTVNEDYLHGSKLAKWYNAPGGRCILVRPDFGGKSRLMFQVITTKDNVEVKRRLDDALAEGDEAFKNLMEELYHDAGWISRDVLKGMRESDDFYCSLFAQIRTDKLHDGRVVLVGDAGYATPGIGTSLAIMGGYVLAGELLQTGGDHERAFKNYAEIMLPFVKSQQGNDSAMQILNPQTQFWIDVRDTILGFVTWTGIHSLVIRGAAALGFTEKKLPLTEYPWPKEEE